MLAKRPMPTLKLTPRYLAAGSLVAGLVLLTGAGLLTDVRTGPEIVPAPALATVPEAAIVNPPAVQDSSSSRAAVPSAAAQTEASAPEPAPTIAPATIPLAAGDEGTAPQDELAPQSPAAVSPPESQAVVVTEPQPSVEVAAAAQASLAAAAEAARPALATVSEPPPAIDGSAFVVMDRACRSVIWGKNENERLPPASLTKIVTALAVMDAAPLDAVAEAHVSGAAMKARGSSVMGVEPGVRATILDLLNGLMLKSGNDAALVLAEYAGGGNVDAFMAAMNAKAQAIGMTNSHFANPHGLDEDGHYSTTLDMAKAGAALLDDPVLAQISATPEYDWEGTPLKNGNKLLQRYPGAYGVKIGYTEGASQTIVAAAERGGRHVIVSVFGSDDRYTDSALLLDWAFSKTTSGCR